MSDSGVVVLVSVVGVTEILQATRATSDQPAFLGEAERGRMFVGGTFWVVAFGLSQAASMMAHDDRYASDGDDADRCASRNRLATSSRKSSEAFQFGQELKFAALGTRAGLVSRWNPKAEACKPA